MELKIYDQQDKRDLYNELKRYQLPYKVRVEPIFQTRTQGQNKYYHKYIKNFLSELEGIEPDKMHEKLLIKYACIGDEVDEYGNEYWIVESTAGMDSMRFNRFCEDCKHYALENHNEYIPDFEDTFDDNGNVILKFIYK